MEQDKPPVELFMRQPGGAGRPRGLLWIFLDTLEVNVPQQLPEPYGSKDARALSGSIVAWKKKNPDKTVAYRTYNGKLWAMLLPDKEE